MKKALRGWMRRFGVDLAPFPLKEYLRRYSVDLVIDVGANAGQYARFLRKLGYRGRILSFEPCRQPFGQLQVHSVGDPLWDCRQLGFGDLDGRHNIRVASDSVFNTLLEPKEGSGNGLPGGVQWVGKEEIELRRMDSYFAEREVDATRILLKLDTQGFERAILAGAKDTLRRIHALQMEMSLEPLYSGQALVEEVLPVVRGLGYQIFGIWPGYRDSRTGRLMEADFLFVRQDWNDRSKVAPEDL